MKKLYFLLSAAIVAVTECFSQSIVETSYFANNPELGGDVVINKSIKEVKGSKTYTSFEVSVDEPGSYNINFWLLATMLKDQSYSHYQVLVNGNAINDEIIPRQADWQDIGLSKGSKVFLNTGTNVISVVGTAPDIPSVEFIKLSKDVSRAMISPSVYKKYKEELSVISKKNAKSNLESYSALSEMTPYDTLRTSASRAASISYDSPLYDFQYIPRVRIEYTFYKTLSFTKDQQVFLTTNGVDNFAHVLEFFSATSPEKYSWNSHSNSNCVASINVKIPQTGMYYVRVRSYLNSRSGLCNLNVNGENYYSNIPIYSMGFTCEQGTDQVYNTFTCYSTGDPRLWIEEYGANAGIVAFNDDFASTGDFSWGRNARVSKKYPRTVHAVLLSSFGSYSPYAEFDIYMKCKNNNVHTSFPNFKDVDCINSSAQSTTYNCISWSGGITSYWEWPPSSFSSYYSSNPLTAFDNFYRSRGLTRQGATESNSVVDLWAIVKNGSRSYQHASVRKGADPNAHGYDWESKPGSLARTFHPRYALEGDGYGEVVEHYIPINGTSATTLDEDIANGTKTIEYVQFTETENNIIKQKISNLSNDVKTAFDTYANEWEDIISNSPYSNLDRLAENDSYKRLANLCKSSNNAIYLAYEKLGKGNVFMVKLIEDISLPSRRAVLSRIKGSQELNVRSQSGAEIIHTPYSNAMSFVKNLLSTENAESYKMVEDNTKYSNSDNFTAVSSDRNITVRFNIDSEAKVSVVITNTTGLTSKELLANKTLSEGTYEYTYAVPSPGTYLIRYVLNGNVNVKKINIQ